MEKTRLQGIATLKDHITSSKLGIVRMKDRIIVLNGLEDISEYDLDERFSKIEPFLPPSDLTVPITIPVEGFEIKSVCWIDYEEKTGGDGRSSPSERIHSGESRVYVVKHNYYLTSKHEEIIKWWIKRLDFKAFVKIENK